MGFRPNRLAATLAAAGAALLLATGVAGAQPFRLIVTHLEPPLVPNSVMDLAVDLGYFEREGVDVELVRVQQTPSAVAALQADEGDMANISVDALLLLVSQGVSDMRAVASPNKSLPFLIASSDTVGSVQDLTGHSFGVGRIGSLDHSLSSKVLEAAGVDLNSIEMVGLGQPAARAQALAAGQVDATTMSIGVWLSLPEKDGLHVLGDQDAYYETVPVINKVNVVTLKVLQERPDDVAAVLRALVKISRDFAANPSAWAEAMAPYGGDLSPEDLQSLAGTFGASWSVNGGMSRSELQYTQDWLYATETFASMAPVTLEQWVDFSVMDGILADLGTSDGPDPAAR